MRVGEIDLGAVARELVHEFQHDNVTGLAAESAYRLVFALPASLIFFAALSSLVARYTGVDVFAMLLALAASTLPAPVYATVNLVLNSIRTHGGTGLLSVGFVLALWSASNAVGAMMGAFNRAYDVTENRGFVRNKLLQIALTAGLSLLVIAAFILFVFGGRLGHWLAALGGYGTTFTAVWDLGRWPAVVLFIMLSLAVLYWVGPAIRRSFRWITPGAVLATLLGLAATFSFSEYLRLSNPGSAYGALGAVVVLLFFLYVSSIILLIGAEVNAVLDKRYDPEVIHAKAAEPARQTDGPIARRRAWDLARREGRAQPAPGAPPATGSARNEEPEPTAPRVAVLALALWMLGLWLGALLGALARLAGRRPAGGS